MKIVVDINHPAHVHFFKNFIRQMKSRGHRLLITASDKDVSLQLLKNLGIEYTGLGSYGSSLIKRLINLPLLDLRMFRAAKTFEPDIFIGLGSVRAAHVAKALRKPCICFEDTEHSIEQIYLYAPFASVICTPSGFRRDLGKKQLWYNGFHQLAYLHPNCFAPDPGVLAQAGVSPGETYIILRFVSWKATHDVGQRGIKNKPALVRLLERYGKVLITSEAPLVGELEKYQVDVPVDNLHHLLYYASLYIGEGGTMASEAAILGTYAFHLSTTAKHCGVFYELNKYGLLEIYDDEEKAREKIIGVLEQPELKRECLKRRDDLLKEKIDMTMFTTWLVEEYPDSVNIMKADPGYQTRFITG